MQSISSEGTSQVIVSFVLEKDIDVAAQEVRDKVNRVVPDLPETAKAPVVQKLDPDATPVMQIVVSSPRPLREVTEIADKRVRPRLENIKGVGQVQIVGGLKRAAAREDRHFFPGIEQLGRALEQGGIRKPRTARSSKRSASCRCSISACASARPPARPSRR